MTRLAGWLLALLLLLVYSRTLYRCALHIAPLGTLSALRVLLRFETRLYE